MKWGNIVVTGGAGFIGSNLVRTLSKPDLDNHVIVIDNLSTGHLDNISELFNKPDRNKAFAITNKIREGQKKKVTRNQPDRLPDGITMEGDHITFINADIRNLALLQNLFKKYKPNYIFHLAALASVPHSIQNPAITHEVNVTGTLNILIASRDAGSVKKIIFSSSCAVYGNPLEEALPIKENQPPDPLSPYATSKLVGEQYCQIFTKMYNLPTACLRYFNVYGPRQDPNGEYAAVIPKFINNALENKPLIIYGDGNQTRDFIFVKDVIQANILAAEDKIIGAYNIGSGKSISIKELAELIADIHFGEAKLAYVDPRPGEIKYSFADVAKIKKYKFELEYNLKDGLKETYGWFKEYF